MKTKLAIITCACLCACATPTKQPQNHPARTTNTAPAKEPDKPTAGVTDEEWERLKRSIKKLTDKSLKKRFYELDKDVRMFEELTKNADTQQKKALIDKGILNVLRFWDELWMEMDRRKLWEDPTNGH